MNFTFVCNELKDLTNNWQIGRVQGISNGLQNSIDKRDGDTLSFSECHVYLIGNSERGRERVKPFFENK